MRKINAYKEKVGYFIYLLALGVILFFCWRNANVLHLYLGPSHAGNYNSMDRENIWIGHDWSARVKVDGKRLRGVSILFDTEENAVSGDAQITVSMLKGEDILQQWTFCVKDIRAKSAYKCILDETIEYDGKELYMLRVSSDAQIKENGVRVLDLQPVLYKVRAQIIKPVLGMLIFLIFVVVIQIGKSKREMYKKYFFMAGIFGVCYLFCLPYGRVPDEVSHFLRIFEVTEGYMTSEIITDEDGVEMRGRTLPIGIDGNVNQHTTVFQDILDQIDRKAGTEKKWYEFSNMALYSPVSYLPQLVGVALGKLISEHVYVIIYLGRFFSFLVSLVLITYALKLLPIKKECMLLTALLPVFFQEMISLSADSFINALSLFIIAYVFYLVYSDIVMTKKQKGILYVLAVLLALCKVVYVPLIFLCFLIPDEKFRNRKEEWLCKATAAVLAVGSNLAWTLTGNIGSAVSASGEGMSQAEWILKYPWEFVNVAYRTVMEFGDKVFLELLGNSLGGLNIKIDELPLLVLGVVMLFYAVIPVGNMRRTVGGGISY